MPRSGTGSRSNPTVPTVAAIRAKAEQIRVEELQKALRRLGGLSEKELKAVDAMSSAIVNKMLHGPTARLKQASGEKDGYAHIESARFLYGLDSNPDGRNPHARLLHSLLHRKEKTSPAQNKEMGDTVGY